MFFIMRVYCNNSIYSIDMSLLEHVTIGNDQSDTLQISDVGLKKHQIAIDRKGEGFTIRGKKLFDNKHNPISSAVIMVGQRYSVDVSTEINIAIHPKQMGEKVIDCKDIKELFIGRNMDNDIILHNPRTSSEHCKIYQEDNLFKIKDLKSTNGTFVNGKRIYEKKLDDGDKINISIYEIVFNHNFLTLCNVDDDFEIKIPPKDEKMSSLVDDIVQEDCEEYEAQISKTGTKSAFDL